MLAVGATTKPSSSVGRPTDDPSLELVQIERESLAVEKERLNVEKQRLDWKSSKRKLLYWRSCARAREDFNQNEMYSLMDL